MIDNREDRLCRTLSKKRGGLGIWAARHATIGAAFALAFRAWSASPALVGPAEFRPEDLQGEVFYVPVAGGGDKSLIQAAKSAGAKLNHPFYEKYHAPLVAAVRSFAQQKRLSIGDQVTLFGWLVIQTHNANKIGYLWGGDLLDGPGAGGSTNGIGYDCSGFVWSVWEAIAPESAFANGGVRPDSHSYLNIGRQVFPRRKVDQKFMENLKALARPGDALIDPNGHIALYGYDPRTRERLPIVMENGEFWNYLDKWHERNKGKTYEVCSTFDSEGRLIPGKQGTLGRALPSLPTPAPLVVASASPRPGARREPGSVSAFPEPSAQSAQPTAEDDEIALLLSQLLGELKAYEDAEALSLPPPRPLRPNQKPAIVSIRAPGARLWNNSLRFFVGAEDPDGDPIVEYRIRAYGTKEWVKSDRARFLTSMPGCSGPAVLEFQVVDARGALSEPTLRRIELVAR